jgi:hypothetical protein
MSASIVYGRKSGGDTSVLKKGLPPLQKFYVANSFDGAMFSTAFIQNTLPSVIGGSSTNSTGTLRFSWFFNAGFTFNFNLSRHIGAFTGIDLKNLGLIQKGTDGYTYKQRTYNIGAPVGLKFGNMASKSAYLFLGGGLDVPINYKNKKFEIRSEKIKYNEWFSNATPALMPYVFAGFVLRRGLSFKMQYYPGNYLNPDYVHNGIKINAGENVQLLYLSVGVSMKYGKKPDFVKQHVSELNTM